MTKLPPMLCKPHCVPECPQCKKGKTMADGEVTGDVRKLRQMLADCEQYLKEGETPAQRIERERRDTEAVLNLLIREKRKTERMRETLQQIAQHFSSEWPERCQSSVLAARAVLNEYA